MSKQKQKQKIWNSGLFGLTKKKHKSEEAIKSIHCGEKNQSKFKTKNVFNQQFLK